MIKTMQMTSLLAAVLAGGMFLLPAAFGAKSNAELERMLKAPNAVEKYQKSKGRSARKGDEQIPPLVKEAKSFALYLNPPRKPMPKPRPRSTSAKHEPKAKVTPKTEPKAKVSAKFKLLGTAYYPSRPELSMALIDEPGKGLSWVNQGQELNHLLFKDIRDGVLTVQDSKGPRQISVPERVDEQRVRNLLKEGNEDAKRRKAAFAITVSQPTVSQPTVSQPVSVTPQLRPEERKKMDDFMSKLSEITSEGTDAGKGNNQKEMIKQFFSNFRSSRISDDEANQVRDLGTTLDKKQQQSRPSRSSGIDRTGERISPGRRGGPADLLPKSDREKRIAELKKLLQQRQGKKSPAATPEEKPEKPKSRGRSSKIAK